MTNRQAQVSKFALNRSEQKKYNPNWWLDLPSTHPLHDATPTRQQRRAVARKAVLVSLAQVNDVQGPNRKERRTKASIMRKTIRAVKKGKTK